MTTGKSFVPDPLDLQTSALRSTLFVTQFKSETCTL